jgi:hypothetical protein
MIGHPPVHLPEQPGRPRIGPLGALVVLACLLGAIACGNSLPSTSAESTQAEATPRGTEATEPGDVDGLVVMTGGALGLGTSDGSLVGLDGPGGSVTAFSATTGRLLVQSAGQTLNIADVGPTGSSAPAWKRIEMATTEVDHWLSPPVLSPAGDLVAFVAADPGSDASFQEVVIDLSNGNTRSQSFDRESNGPPVWIDRTTLLVEVVPIPGGTRFLRLDLTTLRVEPVRADGFGPAISGDGSLLAVAANDGSVVAVPTADWLMGTPPDEGAVVDASVAPFQLAVDAAGRRIAIGYADEAGDPAAIAIFVRDGSAWRRSATPVTIVPGTRTMLGWLN